MTESPYFLARETARLFAMLHGATAPVSRTGFVLSHPFAEEKLWSHRVFVSLARALAARGHPVLRFDYTGAGDSSGGSGETSLETHVADLSAAVESLAERTPGLERIGIIGLRLGATIGALVAERAAAGTGPTIIQGAPLVLWDPVLDGASYLQEVLRANLSAQLATHGRVIETREAMSLRILGGGVVNVDGYEIGAPLFASLGSPGPLTPEPKQHAGPVLVVPISPPGKPPKPQPALEALASAYTRGATRAVEEHQFWREIKQFYGRAEQLQTATLEWLGALDA